MKCIKCGEKSHVTLTYRNSDNTVKRRRECYSCEFRFTTREKPDPVQYQYVRDKRKGERVGERKVDSLYDAWYNNGPHKP